jgi:hypothetical protein
MSIASGLPLTPFYDPRTKTPSALVRSPEFTVYCLKTQILEIDRQIEDFTEWAEFSRQTRELEKYGECILEDQKLILDRFAERYVEEEAREVSSLDEARKVFDSIVDSLASKPRLLLSVGLALLNRISADAESSFVELDRRFNDHFIAGKVFEHRVLKWTGMHHGIARPLQKLLPKMRRAFACTFGTRLRLFLSILGEVFHLREHEESLGIFAFIIRIIIAEIQHSRVFQTFVIWKRFFMENPNLRQIMKGTINDQFEFLFSAFTNVLRGSDLQADFV